MDRLMELRESFWEKETANVDGEWNALLLLFSLPNISIILIRIRMTRLQMCGQRSETQFWRQHDVTRGIFKSHKNGLQTSCGLNWSANRRLED